MDLGYTTRARLICSSYKRELNSNRFEGDVVQMSDEVPDAPPTTSICLCMCEQRPRNSKSRIPRIERGVEPLQERKAVEKVEPVESAEIVDDEVDRAGDAAEYSVQLLMELMDRRGVWAMTMTYGARPDLCVPGELVGLLCMVVVKMMKQ